LKVNNSSLEFLILQFNLSFIFLFISKRKNRNKTKRKTTTMASKYLKLENASSSPLLSPPFLYSPSAILFFHFVTNKLILNTSPYLSSFTYWVEI
jgi:hypothetical protein